MPPPSQITPLPPQAAALPAYASAFDALVLGDGPMDLVLRLLGA